MEPFKLLLTDNGKRGTISMHMIGPKEIRLLNSIADTCSPSLAEPDGEVLNSMLKLGAVGLHIPESTENKDPIPVLTDFGKYIIQLSVFQPH